MMFNKGQVVYVLVNNRLFKGSIADYAYTSCDDDCRVWNICIEKQTISMSERYIYPATVEGMARLLKPVGVRLEQLGLEMTKTSAYLQELMSKLKEIIDES